MKKNGWIILTLAGTFCVGFTFRTLVEQSAVKAGRGHTNTNTTHKMEHPMKLGAFSMSLSVRDLKASKEFYEHLGFAVFGGGIEQNYLIMKNGNALIGLFQGMFDGNILTFNPGWDENAQNLGTFDDVREIQSHLKSNGIALTLEADSNTSGPAAIMLTDPDGNAILIDQHR